jgi:Eukaryotic aspartyl protease
MGFATEIKDTTNIGIIGVSYDASESIASQSGGTPYPSFMTELVAQGVISTRAYSLWLNDQGASCFFILRILTTDRRR